MKKKSPRTRIKVYYIKLDENRIIDEIKGSNMRKFVRWRTVLEGYCSRGSARL